MTTPGVTLLTQGAYPHSLGELALLSDQLVCGMPDIEFRILSVAADAHEALMWELPPNVTRVTVVPTSSAPPARHSPRGRRLSELLSRYEDFLLSLLHITPPEHFAHGLYALTEYARSGELSPALRTRSAARILASAWQRTPMADSFTGSILNGARDATELLERTLRPLAAPAPRDGISHAVGGGPAALPGLAARHFENVPLLLTEYGGHLGESHLGHRAARYEWPVKALLLGFRRLLAREAYAKADVITRGGHYERSPGEHGRTVTGRVRTIYNGIDPAAFPAYVPEPRVPTLVWAGRIDPLRDLDTLIRSFALVRSELPQARLRLFGAVPTGGERYHDQCRALADGLGLTDAVTFDGRVADIRTVYAAGSVVLNSAGEGTPSRLIEAMAYGRPTISTAVGGVREVLGDAGLVVPPHDPEAMASAALGLLRDPTRRAALGRAARLRVIERFTLERTVESFRGIYLSLARTRQDPEGTA
ncbi:GT4 family glycosyltransferase PelF [Streptomyces sp. NBC_00503]|uniref:GT4 family glycosyltransferase PelF n=1 Tax=Streptomyces sp. NBC_00503 TaxID=2903659 RepID=UPI002E80F404|nr:GT4 family glycosyltransferase PelF [Streptomyces sp. NBC_00503]WUD79547.1 GT4 family glycosyltransferase PelF [Streptomyces sp. NBC_00503]